MRISIPARAAAVVATATALLAVQSGPASAAPVYWKLKNAGTHKCLTGGKTSRVFVMRCVSSAYQQWDWIGPGNHYLKNRATGKCLMTNYLNDHRNGVWQSSCTTAKDGEWWQAVLDWNGTHWEICSAWTLCLKAWDDGAVETDQYATQLPEGLWNRI